MTEHFGAGTGVSPVVFPRAGRRELLRAFAARGFTRGAEIGVWRGGFSEEMCKALPGLQLRCVDAWGGDPTYHEAKAAASWDKVRRQAETRLKPYGCVIDARCSTEAAQDVPDGSLDFVHVDANHGREQVYADLAAWVPKVRVGGLLVGHDYREFPRRPMIQVKAAVDAFVRDHGIRDWFVLAREENPTFGWEVR
jgi:hypothetical protein